MPGINAQMALPVPRETLLNPGRGLTKEAPSVLRALVWRPNSGRDLLPAAPREPHTECPPIHRTVSSFL